MHHSLLAGVVKNISLSRTRKIQHVNTICVQYEEVFGGQQEALNLLFIKLVTLMPKPDEFSFYIENENVIRIDSFCFIAHNKILSVLF